MRASTLFVLACVVLFACEVPPVPGVQILKVSALRTLVDNECGAYAMPTANPTMHTIEVREDEGLAYMAIDEGPLRTGTIDAAGALYFTGSADTRFIADEAGLAGCVLTQSETIFGTVVRPLDGGVDGGDIDGGNVDGGTSASSLSLEDNIVFTPTAGSNCAPLLVVFGGPFNALPCTTSFTIRD